MYAGITFTKLLNINVQTAGARMHSVISGDACMFDCIAL